MFSSEGFEAVLCWINSGTYDDHMMELLQIVVGFVLSEIAFNLVCTAYCPFLFPGRSDGDKEDHSSKDGADEAGDEAKD